MPYLSNGMMLRIRVNNDMTYGPMQRKYHYQLICMRCCIKYIPVAQHHVDMMVMIIRGSNTENNIVIMQPSDHYRRSIETQMIMVQVSMVV
jgi:hypothetical protein